MKGSYVESSVRKPLMKLSVGFKQALLQKGKTDSS